jgi:deoxyribonuclease IV
MKFGVHVGIGHGFKKTVEEALAKGCESIQIFAGNPRGFRRTPFDAKTWEEFRRLRREKGIGPTVIHTSYLVNLVTANRDLHTKSIELVAHDLDVAAKGGIEYVNTHLGSYGDQDRKAGFDRVCASIDALVKTAAAGPMLLLENSAGAGNACGARMDELGAIVRAVGSPRVGVCLDTAHAWASGYDISSKKGVDAFVSEVRKHIGLRRVRALHTNDTQVELGSKRDLHWHVAQGKIGTAGFRSLLAEPGLAHAAAICETPDSKMDATNVSMLRRLAPRGTSKRKTATKTELSPSKPGRKRR